MLLQLDLVLAGQLLVLPLELCDEDLPLDLLLLLQRQELLLQLLLPQRGAGARLLLAGRRERRHLMLLVVVVHTQVHGDGCWGETQGQRRVDVHCGETQMQSNTTSMFFNIYAGMSPKTWGFVLLALIFPSTVFFFNVILVVSLLGDVLIYCKKRHCLAE